MLGDRGDKVVESTPTIYDVAERAGVSIATVSRALNSLDSVRPATRDKVLRAMDELDFVPNAVARGLSIGKHGILGLVFTHASSVRTTDSPSKRRACSTPTSSSEARRRAPRSRATRCCSEQLRRDAPVGHERRC